MILSWQSRWFSILLGATLEAFFFAIGLLFNNIMTTAIPRFKSFFALGVITHAV